MITLKSNMSLIDSPMYEYFTEQKRLLNEHFKSIGHADNFAHALTDYDESLSGLLWAEENGTPVGSICFNTNHLTKRVMVINYIRADSTSIQETLVEAFDEFSKQLGCIVINEAVSLKDKSRIEQAEKEGLSQEFYYLFKKV